LVGSAADGHVANPDDFKFSFFESPYVIGLFKPLQNDIKHF